MIAEIYADTGVHPEVSVFGSAGTLFRAIRALPPDFLLLDISIGQDCGIDIARRLNRQNIKTKIIYITSHLELVTEIYQTDYSNILIKPIEKDKLKRVLKAPAEEYLIIRTASNTFHIKQNSIIFIESQKRLAFIHTQTETISVYAKLSELISQLNASFYICHKSFIVNMNCIFRLDNSAAELTDGTTIPVSRAKIKTFQQAYTDYLGELI